MSFKRKKDEEQKLLDLKTSMTKKYKVKFDFGYFKILIFNRKLIELTLKFRR